jgi:hypothetical protein
VIERLRKAPSQIVRDLVGGDRQPRDLPRRYALLLPAARTATFASAEDHWPYEETYEHLAELTDISVDTIIRVADHYAQEIARSLPSEDEVRQAITTTEISHMFRIPRATINRAAVGRILADLSDAGLLEGIVPSGRRFLRMFDPALFNLRPAARPTVVADPPAAGHDQNAGRWIAELEERLDDYVTAALSGRDLMIAAESTLTVLNWDLPEERLTCTLSTSQELPEPPFLGVHKLRLQDLALQPQRPRPDERLVIQNMTYQFEQLTAGWLALRPALCAALGWTVDGESGTVTNDSDDLMARYLWWMDGWWGRNSRTFDDTNAEGHVVMLTRPAAKRLVELVEAPVVHFQLVRLDQGLGAISPATAHRSVPLHEALAG